MHDTVVIIVAAGLVIVFKVPVVNVSIIISRVGSAPEHSVLQCF